MHKPLALTVTQLALASFETATRRTVLILRGECPPEEYQRMVLEKADAAWRSGFAFATGRGVAACVAPWHRRAVANAQRLRQAGGKRRP